MAGLGAVSLNMFWNPAIKGSSFLQASMKGIHTYATKLDKVNILGRTKFPILNKHVESLNLNLKKTQSLTAKISRQPITSINAKQARDDLKERLRLTKAIGKYEKQASYHQGKRSGTRQSIGRKHTSGGAVVGSAIALAPLVLPLKSAMDFETSMLRVKALSGATNKDFKMLEKTALKLGASTEWKATEVSQGMQYLTMAGFKPKETASAMPGLLSLATVGELDLKSTSDIASNIMGAFKIKADKMGMVSDIMAKTITTANVDIQMLGDSLKYSAPVAKKAGMSLAETSALTGLLGNIGIQGSMAGTAMKSIITRLASPPKESEKILNSLNIRTTDKDGNLRSIPLLLQEVYNKTKDKGSGEQLGIMKKIFGLEPLAGGAELISLAGKGELQKYINIVNSYDGTAKKIANIQLSGSAGKMKLLGSAVEGLAISLSSGLLPVLNSFTTKLTSGINSITAWSRENPKLSSSLYGIGIALGVGVVALTAFGFVSTMMSTGLTALAGGFSMVGGAISFMSRALLLNPIGLAITAIAGAGYLIYSNWETIKTKVPEIWSSIVASIKKPFVSVFDWINKKFDALMATFNKIKNFLSIGGDAPTAMHRQKQKNIGLALQTPINNSAYTPTNKIGKTLQGNTLKASLGKTLNVESPSAQTQAYMEKLQAQVTNNNMQQTHQTFHNTFNVTATGGNINEEDLARSTEKIQRQMKHATEDVQFKDAV